MEEPNLAFRPKIKRLFWDIETSPNVVLAFSAGYNITINHDAVISERKVICIGYKWEHSPKVHVLRWSEDQDDKEMLRDFLLVANEADELVGHYADKFDLPWFRTRCLYHRLPPIPLYKTIDTKAWASKYFYFNSNKLDYISNFLGHGRKLKTEFDLWKQILLHNDKKALDYMCKYCGVDVLRLEKVYHDFAPVVKPKSHVGTLCGLPRWTCPRTGTTKVVLHKKRTTSAGTAQYQMKSLTDGSYFTINESTYNKYLEAKRK